MTPKLNVPESISSELHIDPTNKAAPLIFDPIRQKWVALTPEEWVRQNMVPYIAEILQAPKSHIGNEIMIKYNGLTKRCDSIIYDNSGNPLIILEYKRPTIKITQKVFDQIAIYNMKLNVPYLIISNGIDHFFCHVDRNSKKYIFAREGCWPTYASLISHTNI